MVDSATIILTAGKGGDGIVSFRREKYVPRGGPDGGDGGNGADIYFCVNKQLSTLVDYTRLKTIKAKNGNPGGTNQRHGKDGDDLFLYVPVGTQIFERQNDKWVSQFDLVEDGSKVLIAKGGRGGWGNVHFATAVNQAPMSANKGMEGETKELKLELKLIADVGIIGLPNAGKSTLISVISNCKPKIADYPFTTLEPNLGVVSHKGKTFVVADIPGLIEGASTGKGLGDKFLRHIERTTILVHLISAKDDDIERSYQTIRTELKNFQPDLLNKIEIIVINKADLLHQKSIGKFIKKHSAQVISAVTRRGVSGLLDTIIEKLT